MQNKMKRLLRNRAVKNDTHNREAVLRLLVAWFGSTRKAELWLTCKNPLLGGITPEFMISIGRSDRLLKFVKNCLDGNRRPQ